jgi:ubiquitin carboxyl-terminal hydrolase L3
MAEPTEIPPLTSSTTSAPSAESAEPQPPKRKRFIPLENNPDVMNNLVHTLGLSPSLAFQDVFSIDDPELLEFVPRPAHALLLIFPVSQAYEKARHDEDLEKQDYEGAGEREVVLWFRQTIGNACGLIGLLHAVGNGEGRNAIGLSFPSNLSPFEKLHYSNIDQVPKSNLDIFFRSAIPLQPSARADLLYESQALEDAHQQAAAGGDTSAPSADDRVDLHFVCFVKASDGNLWELDGRRKGPLNRGPLPAGEDVLGQKALDAGPRVFMRREAEAGGDLRFSLIALVPSMD